MKNCNYIIRRGRFHICPFFWYGWNVERRVITISVGADSISARFLVRMECGMQSYNNLRRGDSRIAPKKSHVKEYKFYSTVKFIISIVILAPKQNAYMNISRSLILVSSA